MKIRTKNGIHFATTERIDRKKREMEIFSEQIVPLQNHFSGLCVLCSVVKSVVFLSAPPRLRVNLSFPFPAPAPVPLVFARVLPPPLPDSKIGRAKTLSNDGKLNQNQI